MAGRMAAWLLEPHARSRAERRRWLFAGLLWLVAVGFAVGPRLVPLFGQSDVIWYLKLARGEHDVMQPFAARQLAPLLIRGLVRVSGIPVEAGFVALGSLSYALFAGCVLWLLLRRGTPRWVVLLVLGMSFWPFAFAALALPDLLFSALTAAFLVLLGKRHDLAAALLLLPLTVSREATLLTLACLLIAAWRRVRWEVLGLAVAAFLLGSRAVQHLAVGAIGNAQGMPPAIYLVGKLPWNALRNLTGVDLYTNLSFCGRAAPLWQHAFHLHGVAHIGICEVESISPRLTFGALTACFGVLPVLLVWLWQRRAVRWRDQSVLIRFCLVYGAVSYALAPGLGTGVGRLVRYAWPVFLVGLPELARQMRPQSGQLAPGSGPGAAASPETAPELISRIVVPLVLLHLAVAWSEAVLPAEDVVFVSLPGMVAAWGLLWRVRAGAGRRSAVPANPTV